MSNLNSVIQEIETQRQKPLEVQLEDFKIAGAKLIIALDRYISTIGENKDGK